MYQKSKNSYRYNNNHDMQYQKQKLIIALTSENQKTSLFSLANLHKKRKERNI
jgi:hypothetical protein